MDPLAARIAFAFAGPDHSARIGRGDNSETQDDDLAKCAGLEPLSSCWHLLAPSGKDSRCAVASMNVPLSVHMAIRPQERAAARRDHHVSSNRDIPGNCIIVSMVKKTLFLSSTQDVNSVALSSGRCSPTIDGACKWSCIQQPASRLGCSCIAQPGSCNLDDKVP